MAGNQKGNEQKMKKEVLAKKHSRRRRSNRTCHRCKACLRKTDCGECDFCKDKPMFSGPYKKRQKCRWRQCRHYAMKHLLPRKYSRAPPERVEKAEEDGSTPKTVAKKTMNKSVKQKLHQTRMAAAHLAKQKRRHKESGQEDNGGMYAPSSHPEESLEAPSDNPDRKDTDAAMQIAQPLETQHNGESGETPQEAPDCSSDASVYQTHSSERGEYLEESIKYLKDLFPQKKRQELEDALRLSEGDIGVAADELLENVVEGISGEVTAYEYDGARQHSSYSHVTPSITPREAVNLYRTEVLEKESLHSIEINRMGAHMIADILGIYKEKGSNLRCKPKIHFTNEEGVGSGPLREYFDLCMNILERGVHMDGICQPLFEGESDHKITVQNGHMRQAGLFYIAGKIISHLTLHGGPGLHGLSPAVISYIGTSDIEKCPLDLRDLPDLTLRCILQDISETDLSQDLKNEIRPYRAEINLPSVTKENKHFVVQELLRYHVLGKRLPELGEFMRGLAELSLLKYLCRFSSLSDIVFPRQSERCIDPISLIKRITVGDNLSKKENRVFNYLKKYIEELHSNSKGATLSDLVCFWTGSEKLLAEEEMCLRFCDDHITMLPTSQSCLLELTVPTSYAKYEDFRSNFHVALTLGSKGFATF